jgi:hypothetical protein
MTGVQIPAGALHSTAFLRFLVVRVLVFGQILRAFRFGRNHESPAVLRFDLLPGHGGSNEHLINGF